MVQIIKVIDVQKAFKESKNKSIRNLPKFIVNIIKKTIRQDELNKIHTKYADLIGMDYVKSLLFKEFNTTVNIFGEDNVDKNKKYVYIANHPQGGIDALSFLYLVDKIHGNVVSPSNQLFEYIPNLHSLIVGIDVFKQNTKERIKMVNDAFESDSQVMIFPAGEVSRKIKGKIVDPEWQKTFVSKAVQFNRDIVPVFITGHNSKKFYTVEKIRKFLGIKTYVETLLLPQEMLKQRNITVNMYIGKLIKCEEIKNSDKSHQQWTEAIKKYIYSLNPSNIKKQLI